MTFEQCHEFLQSIRSKQGTDRPLVRIELGKTTVQGRVARSDSDPGRRRPSASPFGVLVLESPGLVRTPETIVQIADIPDGGMHDPSDH